MGDQVHLSRVCGGLKSKIWKGQAPDLQNWQAHLENLVGCKDQITTQNDT